MPHNERSSKEKVVKIALIATPASTAPMAAYRCTAFGIGFPSFSFANIY
jgi:hypothetical protein